MNSDSEIFKKLKVIREMERTGMKVRDLFRNVVSPFAFKYNQFTTVKCAQ